MVYIEWKIKWVYRYSVVSERLTCIANDMCALVRFLGWYCRKTNELVTRPGLNNVLNGILATTRGLVRVINAPRSPTIPTATLKTHITCVVVDIQRYFHYITEIKLMKQS